MPLSITEDIIRHNIAQITSTSKTYIPCRRPLSLMSNERQRQASTTVVVAKDSLKNRQEQNVTLCKTKQQQKKIINTYLKRHTHTTDG